MLRLLSAVAAIAALAGSSAIARGEASGPVVVELFTSQGCSSCPAANAFAGELSQRDDVLVLSFAISYWNYLGWRDTFARPEFVERQRGYAAHLDNRRPYTPQMVVDGHVDRVGVKQDEIVSAIEHCRAHANLAPSIDIARDHDALVISLGADAPREAAADVWLVGFIPGETWVAVERGENAGKELPHYNVVRSVTRVGGWTGAAETVTTAVEPDLAYAVIVQAADSGPILAAAEAPAGDAA